MISAATAWMDRTFFPAHSDNWDDAALREKVLSVLSAEMLILDIGAGAGVAPFANYRGMAAKVCGIDLDPRIMANPNLDEAYIVDAGAIPYPADTFDIAVCSNVLEHLDDPEGILREISRVLKPGGILFFKTPNRWHYVALIARLSPMAVHRFVMRWRGTRVADDVFPTYYRANTVNRLRTLAKHAGLSTHHIVAIEGRPEYLRTFAPAYALGAIYERVVNALPGGTRFRSILIGTMTKPASEASGVADFWQQASCGERALLSGKDYAAHSAARYALEPYIIPFLAADQWSGKRVLEIGVGLGADHELLARGGAILSGVDLTARAVEHTRRRFELAKLRSDLRVANAENLPFADETFDAVISYGVIHHSPDTTKAAAEILRVLKPYGEFRVMVYHRRSVVGAMLWLRYGIWRGLSLAETFARYNESPGTKAYTPEEFRRILPFECFRIELTHADLLTSYAGQRHEGRLLTIARAIWPRRFLQRFGRSFGVHLLVTGTKLRRIAPAFSCRPTIH